MSSSIRWHGRRSGCVTEPLASHNYWVDANGGWLQVSNFELQYKQLAPSMSRQTGP